MKFLNTVLFLTSILSSKSSVQELENTYWGPGSQPDDHDDSIKPFKVVFTDEIIADLRDRLGKTRQMQPPLEDSHWTYGISTSFLPTVLSYWKEKYDFKSRERYLNQFPQFVTNIQGLNVHFYHVKPSQLPENHREIRVLPILLVHGWPNVGFEFHKAIPMLTSVRDDRDFVFEVIAPSLPGFGFSDAASKMGLGPVEMARMMAKLMARLGHEKFYVHGGDWGGVVITYLAHLYPDKVLGLHSNLCLNVSPRSIFKIIAYRLTGFLLPKDEYSSIYPLYETVLRSLEESGYWHEQATRPDTLGVGLNDSPAGLAAYLLEKIAVFTSMKNRLDDDGGSLLEAFTLDELIDNLMFFWVPNKITSSMRIYAEGTNVRELILKKLLSAEVKVPSACTQFPDEPLRMPFIFLRDRFQNMVHETKQPRGGHFAAMQEPQLLVDDIFNGIQKMTRR